MILDYNKLWKLMIDKNINKTPTTINAIFIRLATVDVFELGADDTLLTVDVTFEFWVKLVLEESFCDDVLFEVEVELTLEFVWLVFSVLFVVDELSAIWELADELFVDVVVFSVKFKSIP